MAARYRAARLTGPAPVRWDGSVSFSVAADAYDRFMGRWSSELAPSFLAFAGVAAPMRVLDVGCGPGALTVPLAELVGAGAVAAADPSQGFAEVCAERVPGADVRRAAAEALPWEDGGFDAALAQLVLPFLDDPALGAAEMRRVVRPGGVVAACSWDIDGMELLTAFWAAAETVGPGVHASADAWKLRTREALVALWRAAALSDVEAQLLEVTSTYGGFDELWEPLTTGVGPPGAYVAGLAPEGQAALREELHRVLGAPDGPFTLRATAWAVRGVR
jgi:ubiquinone/menaquinone biosynthesis C-methylase UbiE